MSEIVEDLTGVNASKVLIRAAKAGFVSRYECVMDECYCPGGRSDFWTSGRPLGPWMPTADHRKRKMDGGTLALANIRLAHRICNFVDYAMFAGISCDRYLERARQQWEARRRPVWTEDDIQILKRGSVPEPNGS